MKKALLYTLLFLLLTIVVFFVLIFAVPFILWSGSDAGSHESNIFDTNPLLLPSLSVIIWALITLFVFIRNKYSDLSFGNIKRNDCVRITLIGAVSMVFLKIALQPLQWIINNEISDTQYSTIQLWMNNDMLVIFLLMLIHLTLEAVIFSAILRELIIWSKRPFISVLLVSIVCTLPSLSELTAPAVLPLLFTFIPLLYGGWLYYRTCSIWPSFLGMTLYDILLLATPMSEYITLSVIAALALPWIVIYLAKKLTSDVEPVISR